MKEQSKEWTSPGEGENGFIGRKGHGHRFLEKGRTITGQYYADLLGRFEAELMKRLPHLA